MSSSKVGPPLIVNPDGSLYMPPSASSAASSLSVGAVAGITCSVFVLAVVVAFVVSKWVRNRRFSQTLRKRNITTTNNHLHLPTMAMNSTAFANKKQQQMLDMETDKNPAVNYSIAKGSPNTAPVLSFPSGAGYDSYLASLSASTNEMLARINVTSMQASARKMLDEAIAVFHTAQDEEVGFESLGESDGEDNDEEETLTDKMDLSAFLPTRLRREDSTASVVSASEEQGQQQQQQMESHALWNSPWTPHDLDSSSFTSHAVGIVPAPVRSASPAVSNVSSNNNNNNNVGSSSSSNNASVSINMPSSLLPPDPSLANLANSVDSLPATILQVQSYPLLDEMTSSADAHNNYSSLPSPPSTEPSSPVIPVRKVVIKRSRELDLA